MEKYKVYELLLTSDGKVTEGSRSNIFFIKGQTIFTAPGDSVLKGITRKKIFGVCKKIRFEVIEKVISINELSDYEAAFLSGTSPKVLPIKQIQGLSEYDTQNETLNKVREAYDELIDSYQKTFKWVWE